MSEISTLYRFYNTHYGTTHSLQFMRLPVLSSTKCGEWIEVGYQQKKFVNRDAKRRFAYPTLDEAFVSYQARKSRQISILTNQLEVAKAAAKLTMDRPSLEETTLNIGEFWKYNGY